MEIDGQPWVKFLLTSCLKPLGGTQQPLILPGFQLSLEKIPGSFPPIFHSRLGSDRDILDIVRIIPPQQLQMDIRYPFEHSTLENKLFVKRIPFLLDLEIIFGIDGGDPNQSGLHRDQRRLFYCYSSVNSK